jgi:hypothetical protein
VRIEHDDLRRIEMKRRIWLAAAAVVSVAAGAPGAAEAKRASENELRYALIQMDPNQPERGQTVDQFIQCLQIWNPGDRKAANKVQIARLNEDTFTVTADLRTRSIFHFQVTHEHGYDVALLRRVEYVQPRGAAYQQITDAETKRAVVTSACAKP